MTTWTESGPSTATWSTEEPYDLYDFLLMEDGYKLLQQDEFGILLQYSWGPTETTGTWTSSSPTSGGFSESIPTSSSWTEQTVN